MRRQSFSIKSRCRSIQFAWDGIVSFLKLEHNSWIHLVATMLVIAAALITGISRTEMIALVIVMGLVWMSELFNTAIEKIMDFVSLKQRDEIRLIKDISAAAVLVSSITAFITGAIIFIPKFLL